MKKKGKIDWYWMGKPPRVRKAVEEYLHDMFTKPRIEGWRVTMADVADKYGCNKCTVSVNVVKLQENGLLYEYENYLREKMENG